MRDATGAPSVEGRPWGYQEKAVHAESPLQRRLIASALWRSLPRAAFVSYNVAPPLWRRQPMEVR
jgi:hypothetical protein